jgi:hypothetical protein
MRLLNFAVVCTCAAAVDPTWTGTSPAYEYTDATCTSGKSAAPVSTTTKSIRNSANTSCISVTAGSNNEFYRQTCTADATAFTQQSCDSASCTTCTGSALTYTIKKMATGSCLSYGGNHYMATVSTTTAGDHDKAAAPCLESAAPKANTGNSVSLGAWSMVVAAASLIAVMKQ